MDLRDRGGKTQLRFNADTDPAPHNVARLLRSEFVIAVRGEVTHRGDDKVNKKLPTGEIEIVVKEIDLLNKSETPPFEIKDHIDT
ncbi:MAG: OB-fold nucleic acid binding domain-containing protein, partial [Planctomycetota bacterium]|nr:OB-fold nucleic acid binding domain-containing protein [Planctomycetota bacterium]